MAFRFPHSFRLWLLTSLKTSSNRLYYAPLFLKLFASASLGFFFLEICPIIVQDCFWWFLTSHLGVVPFIPFLGLLCLFFFFVFSGSKSYEVLGLVGWGSSLFIQIPFFLFSLAYLHGSWSLLCFSYRE